MSRPVVIDVDRTLPPRARPLAEDAIGGVFGGCQSQGSTCRSTSECCQVWVAPGDYVLCYFYRGHGGFVTAYCTKSSVAHGT